MLRREVLKAITTGIILMSSIGNGSPAQKSLPTIVIPSVVRDAAAEAVLRKTLSALDPSGVSSESITFVASGTSMSYSTPSNNGIFRWTTKGAEFKYELDSSTGATILLSGLGKPSISKLGKTYSLALKYGRNRVFVHLPSQLLFEYLSDPAATIQTVEMTDPECQQCFHISTSFASDATHPDIPPLLWTIAPSSYLPQKIEYDILYGEEFRTVKAHYTFLLSSYSNINPIAYPEHLESYVNGRRDEAADISALVVLTSQDNSIFAQLQGDGQ